LPELQALCFEKVVSSSLDGPVVVFVTSKDKARVFGGSLTAKGVPNAIYTSESLPSQRVETLKQIESGTLKVVVATSAMSVGVDISRVRAVIHYGLPFSLIDFIQESGRGGRDGQKASSFIFMLEGDETTDGALNGFIKGESCRRAIISEFLDGEAYFCVQNSDAAYCDICLKSTSMVTDEQVPKKDDRRPSDRSITALTAVSASVVSKGSDLTKVATASQKQSNSAGSGIKRSLDRPKLSAKKSCVLPSLFLSHAAAKKQQVSLIRSKTEDVVGVIGLAKTSGCVVCLSEGKKEKHGLQQCPTISSKRFCLKCLGVDHSRSQCAFKKVNGCFRCALPGKINGVSIHPNGYGMTCDSGLEDVVLPLAWIGWRNDRFKKTLTKMTGNAKINSDAEFFSWAMVTDSETGLSNAVTLAIRVYNQLQDIYL
jgi:hypothetical protein